MNEKLFDNCLHKQEEIKKTFAGLCAEEKYKKIIELGKLLKLYPEEHKTPHYTVSGCQSTLYLYSYLEEDKVFFLAHSESLISAGLAALLITVYSNETPEVILKCPPSFLEAIGIHTSLTPGRSNGLKSMHLRMQQEALALYSNLMV